MEIGETGKLAVGQQPLREVGTDLRGRHVQRRCRIRPAEAQQRRGKGGERLMVQRDGPGAAQSLAHRRVGWLQRVVPIAVPLRHEVCVRDDARRDGRQRPLGVPPHGGALRVIGSDRVEERHDGVEDRPVVGLARRYCASAYTGQKTMCAYAAPNGSGPMGAGIYGDHGRFFSRRAKALSTLRGWTVRLNSARTRRASSGARRAGSSACAWCRKSTTSGLSLCDRRGPGFFGTSAASRPRAKAAWA